VQPVVKPTSSLLLASVCSFVFATTVKGDCGRPRSAVAALKQSDVVFRGTVREIDVVPFSEPGFLMTWTGRIIRLDISQVWKGRVGQRFVLHIAQSQEDDAFEPFERGLEYLVFAVRNSPH